MVTLAATGIPNPPFVYVVPHTVISLFVFALPALATTIVWWNAARGGNDASSAAGHSA